MLSTLRTCCFGIPQRWIFVLMAFVGLWIGNGLRVILSITITEMVVPMKESFQATDNTCADFERRIPKNVTFASNIVYNWDEYTQGVILSSYFWGYAATQFLFGALAERFGGKYLLGLGIFVPAVLTFVTPMTIYWGESTALIVVRVLMGVTSGAMYPAVSTMISQWSVTAERTKFGSIIYAGAILGTVFGTTMPALIIRYSGMDWPGVFYFFGAVGMIWFPIWSLTCYSKPQEHPYISEVELKYLQESLEGQKQKKSPPAPWRHILLSKQFWAFVMGLVGCDWAYFTMANDLPKYMSSVVRFSIEDNGYMSSLPYLSMWFMTILGSWITDQIFSRKLLTQTNIRKLFATISLIGPAVFMVGASYAECDQLLVVIMFILGMTLMGCSYPSIMVNALDLSPNYAGTLMAIGNGIAALGGVLTPYIIGVLTPNQTIGEWRLVFWIVFGVAIVTNLYFLIYASGEVQEWNDPDFERKKTKMTTENKDKKKGDEESMRF